MSDPDLQAKRAMHLNQTFPKDIEERCTEELGLPPRDTTPNTNQLEDFLHTILPSRKRVAMTSNQFMPLGEKKYLSRPGKKVLIPKESQQHRGKKRMTASEKRNNGLLMLKKHNKTFKMFIPIHRLWRKYAQELLGVSRLLSEKWTAGNSDKRTETIQNRLKKIEYYGSFIKVTQSRCPTYVGIQGIIIQETKNTFTLITEKNLVKVIPKLHSEFSFVVNEVGFTVLGNHLHQRPVDRAKQTVKKHCLWL